MTIQIKIKAKNALEARDIMINLLNLENHLADHTIEEVANVAEKTPYDELTPIEDLPSVTEETLPQSAVVKVSPQSELPVADTPPPPAESENPAPPPAESENPAPPPPNAVPGSRIDDSEREILDSEFLPWDKRIHSNNRQKIADGTWRIVRKPKQFTSAEEWKAYIAQIKKELNGLRINGLVDPTEPQNFEALTKFALTIIKVPEYLEIIRKYDIPNMTAANLPENRVLIPVIYSDLVKIKEHRSGND